MKRASPAASADDTAPGGDNPAKRARGAAVEEADPLDAFMAEINDVMSNQGANGDAGAATEAIAPPHLAMDEQSDGVDAYVAQKTTDARDAVRTSRDPAARVEYDEDDMPLVAGDGEMEELPPVDHASVDYPAFEKCFYTPHPDVAGKDATDAELMRVELGCSVQGRDVPCPVNSFAHLGWDARLLRPIAKAGFESPTPVQSQALPVVLSGRDVLARARTGSGKTLAYTWPLLVHVAAGKRNPSARAWRARSGEGGQPLALVLAPTRELALQIQGEVARFAKPFGLSVVPVFGGASKWQQQQQLKAGAHVVVGTPGRVVDMIRCGSLSPSCVTFLVLDEADRMFQLGFAKQLWSVVGQLRPDRQVLLFSATFRPRVERLARAAMRDPVRISIGSEDGAASTVSQQVVVLKDDMAKWPWLLPQTPDLLRAGKLLIFTASKDGADMLSTNLNRFLPGEARCEALHGGRHQADRSNAVRRFRQGSANVLVATDVAARGLDIPAVGTVVNYDAAKNIDIHVHRVGRTGRMDKHGEGSGAAITLVTDKETTFAGALVENLEASGQPVPEPLLRVASRQRNWRARRTKGGFAGGAASYYEPGAGNGAGGGRGGRPQRNQRPATGLGFAQDGGGPRSGDPAAAQAQAVTNRLRTAASTENGASVTGFVKASRPSSQVSGPSLCAPISASAVEAARRAALDIARKLGAGGSAAPAPAPEPSAAPASSGRWDRQ